MKKFLLFSLISLMLNACSESTSEFYYVIPTVPTYIIPGTTNPQGQYAIAFGNYVNGQTRAMINSNSNTGYDDFTLYTWTKDSIVMDGWHAQWITNSWTYVGVDNQQVKYFDNFVNEYNFIGVIPQINSNISNGIVTTEVESFTVDNETSVDTPKEFLYAYTTVQKPVYSQGVFMNFKHGNAKTYIKFTSDDSNTEIIDYHPGTEGYDVYTTTATTFSALGPLLTSVNISDEDIDYINSHYTASKGFDYKTGNVIEGDLNTNMYDYLANKYQELSTIDLANWSNYVTNQNMRLIHIDKTGKTAADNDSYSATFVNIQNVNWNEHSSSGVEDVKDIVVLPATSVIGDGTDAVLSVYPTSAYANISLNGVDWNVSNTSTIQKFTKPLSKITSNDVNSPIESPTTWYALPCKNNNVGFTIKFSYKYKGVNVYDSRVFIPAEDCDWKEGKYYTYVIQINGRGNGHVEPNNIDADDPVIEQIDKNEIKLFKIEFSDYSNGGVIIKEIK